MPRPPLALFLATSAAAQGFWSTCPRWSLGWEDSTVYPSIMVAECTDDSGATRASFLPLNDCLANKEGEILGQRSGNGIRTCRDCEGGGSLLTCECARTFGGPVISTVDLDDVIKSVDGIISCYDFMGVEIDSFEASPA